MAFVFGDLFSERFCGSFHLLGIQRHTGQFGQQFTAFLEADHRTDRAHHAREGGRQGSVFYLQMRVARTVTLATGGAVIVGAFESQGAQHTDDVLGAARDITRSVPTRTTKCTRFIGKIGVETLLNGVGREPQSPLAQSDFQGLEIQLREGLPP